MSMNNPAVGYLGGQDQPVSKIGRLPNTDGQAGLNKATRKSAKKMAQFFREQFEAGLRIRRRHALAWIKVQSIMAGVHYFRIVNGVYEPLAKKDGQVRANIPVMDWLMRWQLGSFNANIVGIKAYPINSNNADSFYMASRAQAIMDNWLEEADIQEFFDEANQHLLHYGTSGYFRYKDTFRGNIFLKSIPAPELFPIPFDSRSWKEADGIMRVTNVSKQWLEAQDELYEQKYGKKPDPPMAKKAGNIESSMSATYTGFATSTEWGGRYSGCTALWIWMRPTETNPYGEHAFMLEDEMYRYISGVGPDGRLLALPDGEIPIEPVHYDKQPSSFWASGFGEKLISTQREVNRQWSTTIENSIANRGFTAYNSQAVHATDIQNALDGLVPFQDPGPDTRIQPVFRIPAANIGADVGSVLSMGLQTAERAACYESGIPFGRQEGRTEGGPATGLLDSNSKAPIQPVFNRIHRAFSRTFPRVLDGLRDVWPENKIIRAVGPKNMAREMAIQKQGFPTSNQVILRPTPLTANGRLEQMNSLYQLRQLPSQDGKGFMVADHEFRSGMSQLGLAPPGIELENRAEMRIVWRIEQLIGDGKQPYIQPSMMNDQGMVTAPEQQFEDHRLAIKLITDQMLEPSFRLYSQQVRNAMKQELQYHILYATATQTHNFDNDSEMADMKQADNALEYAENDPNSNEGEFSINGLPLGA